MSKYFEQKAARQKWQQQWPNHCSRCEGTGVLEYSDDPSPPGVSLAPATMRFTEPCFGCLGYDLCPRCGNDLGETTDDDKPFVCPHCGWESENPDYCPPAIVFPVPSTDDPVYQALQNAGMSQTMLTWFCGDYESFLPAATFDEVSVMQIANRIDQESIGSQRDFDLTLMHFIRESRDFLTKAIRSLELVYEPTSFAEAESMGYELLGEQPDDQGAGVRRDYQGREEQQHCCSFQKFSADTQRPNFPETRKKSSFAHCSHSGIFSGKEKNRPGPPRIPEIIARLL